jgi:hypothetical protein
MLDDADRDFASRVRARIPDCERVTILQLEFGRGENSGEARRRWREIARAASA